MNTDKIRARLQIVRNAEFDAHAQRMCVLGYIGALHELDIITGREYLIIAEIADNACAYRRKELQNAI